MRGSAAKPANAVEAKTAVRATVVSATARAMGSLLLTIGVMLFRKLVGFQRQRLGPGRRVGLRA